MQSKTDICNNALLSIGHSELVANIDSERSLAAEHCRTFWKVAVNAVLEGINPSFARRIAPLAKVDHETSLEFRYVYATPSDCLIPRQVTTEKSLKTRKTDLELINDFMKGVTSDGKSKTILTNTDDAYLIYTTSEVDTYMFDNVFCISLSLLLASKLALSLKKDAKLAANLNQSYENTLSKSEANDANSQSTNTNYAYNFSCDAIDSRLRGWD